MVRVNDGMVDKLDHFAKEVTRVSHEFGTQYIFGGYACMDGVQGTWADLTVNLTVSFLSSSIILRFLPFFNAIPELFDISPCGTWQAILGIKCAQFQRSPRESQWAT